MIRMRKKVVFDNVSHAVYGTIKDSGRKESKVAGLKKTS